MNSDEMKALDALADMPASEDDRLRESQIAYVREQLMRAPTQSRAQACWRVLVALIRERSDQQLLRIEFEQHLRS